MTTTLAPRRHVPRAVRRLWYGIGSLGGALVLLVLAELLTRTGILPSRYLPPPSEVLVVLAGELATSEAWLAVASTLRGWAFGLGIAILVAVPLGVLIASNEFFYRATRPIIEFLRPVPSVALIPLVFLMFAGALDNGKVFLAVFAATWPLLVQTVYGVRNILPAQIDTARSFQIPTVDILTRVVIPATVPYLATGIRISSTVALILVLTGEIVIGGSGIGVAINDARQGNAITAMYAYVVLAGVLGLVLNAAFAALERRALHWHPSQRGVTS